jgi:DNA ligase-associated metallophosphoesterase
MQKKEIKINDREIIIAANRTIYLPENKTLLVADTHFGKVSHMRKHGLAIPSAIIEQELDRFFRSAGQFPSERIIILGDMFHSDINQEVLATFAQLKKLDQQLVLVKGNHDRYSDETYLEYGISEVHGDLSEGEYQFTHKLEATNDQGRVYFGGHVHPGVRLRDGSADSQRLPAFILSENEVILPAFNHFAGLSLNYGLPMRNAYAIANGQLFKF